VIPLLLILVAPPGGVERCSAIHSLLRDPEKQIVLACGAHDALPPDRYRVWREQGETVSLQQRDRDTGDFTMVPAARVALNAPVDEKQGVRFINFTQPFVRPVAGDEALTPVRIPPGHVAGGVFDRQGGDAIALFRGIDVAAGTTTRFVEAANEKQTSNVYAELELPPGKKGAIERPALDVGGRLIPASEFVDAAERVHAIWFNVPGKLARLVVVGANVRYDGRDVVLRPGKVTTLRSALRLQPSIDVAVNISADGLPPLFVKIGERRIAVKNHQTTHIESLDVGPLRVFLEIPPWKIAQNVDLSEGRDAAIAYDLTPIEVSGVVRYGRDRAKAKIGFMDYDGFIDVDTDDDGAYHTVVWSPRDYVTRVTLRNAAPFVDLVAIYESGTYDFDLPRSRYVVRVRNAVTRQPIASANILYENVWTSEKRGGQNVVFNATSDERGEAVLPPLRPGTVSVRAEAKGFERSASHEERVDNDAERTIDVDLQPVAEATVLKVALPDGTPARGAELMATAWRGATDDDGSVEIPKRVIGALLLVRHAKAAGSVRVWNGEELLRLQDPAPPLTIQTDDGQTAQITAIIDGIRVSGFALAFLAWSSPATDRSGIWIARNLPCAPTPLLAWKRLDPAAIASGSYDGVATVVPCPWPNRITLRSID
jgi:carboxypeptidase family protein